MELKDTVSCACHLLSPYEQLIPVEEESMSTTKSISAITTIVLDVCVIDIFLNFQVISNHHN